MLLNKFSPLGLFRVAVARGILYDEVSSFFERRHPVWEGDMQNT